MKSPNALNVLLPKILHDISDTRGRALIEINLHWQHAVGQLIGSSTRILHLQSESRILIEVDSPLWIKAVKDSKSLICERIKKFSNSRYSIKFFDFVHNESTRTKPRRRVSSETSAPCQEAVLREAEAIEDSHLREIFLKAYRAYTGI